MPFKNSTTRWGHLAQLLHWVIVALILVQVIYGLRADYFEAHHPMVRYRLLIDHKSYGMLILGLALVRLIWRAVNPTPELPEGLKPYERGLAHFTHWGLYGLLFALPLSGWLTSSAYGYTVTVFKLLKLPNLVEKSPPLYEVLRQSHHVLVWVLGAMLVLHVGAALKHHFVLKDDVLKRMLPFTGPASASRSPPASASAGPSDRTV